MLRINRRYRQNNILKYTIPFIIILTVMMIGIGYSAFVSNMNIGGTVAKIRKQADIRVTGLSVYDTNQASTTYTEYNVKSISSGLVLAEETSSITFAVEVTNIGAEEAGIYNITGLPDNLKYELVDSNGNNYEKTKICIETGNCTLGISKELYLKISYLDGSTETNFNTVYNLNLDIDFEPFYNVTYTDIDGSYQKEILKKDTLRVNFGNNAPSDLEIVMKNITLQKNIDYTYSGGVLTLPNVNGNIEVSAVIPSSGGGSGTESDPYIITNKTYDAEAIEEPGVTKFDNAPGAPEVTAIDDGSGNMVITSFEYTTASEDNPVVITSGNPVETGVLALDGKAFTIHIRFKANFSEVDSNNTQINKNKFIVSAFECNNNVYNGFAISSLSTNYLREATFTNVSRSSGTSLLTPKTYNYVPSKALSAEVHEFDVTLTYNPTGYQSKYGTLVMSSKIDGVAQSNKTIRNTSKSTNVPTTLNNAVVTIGGNGINNDDDFGNIEILEFSVTR